jgi:ABC-type branched-subunit amino acid transport system substrate-binding protein
MLHFLVLIVSVCLLHVCHADVPSTINLGGIFNIYDANGVADTKAIQHLSAFLLAIDQINKRTDILPNTTINYVIRNAYDLGADIEVDEMIEEDVLGVISSLSSSESYHVNAVTNLNDIVTVNSGHSLESSLTDSYDYSFQTSPLESQQSKFLQKLFCLGGAIKSARVILFLAQDETYLNIANSFTTGEYCIIDVAATYVFRSTRTSFDREIAKAIDDQSTNVVVFMPDDMAALFLQQAYDLGLIRYGVSVVTSTNILTPAFTSKFADPVSVLKSTLSVADFPSYNVRTTQQGNKFLNSFINQASTIATCGSAVDVTGYKYLYRNGSAASGPCIGLNYTTYKVNQALISFEISYTYDSVFAWAYAVDGLLKQGASLSSDALADKLKQVSFSGASGPVSFAQGTYVTTYNVGRTRVGRFAYMIYQYQDIYAAIIPITMMINELGFRGCAGIPVTCRSPRYNNADNTPADGYPPYSFASLPSILRIAGIFDLYEQNGLPVKDRVECLAAFLMAINEVNNKADGIFDTLLPATKVKYQVAFGSDYTSLFSSADYLFSGYFGKGVTGVVSTLDSNVGQAIDQFLTEIDVMQVRSVSSEVKQGKSA